MTTIIYIYIASFPLSRPALPFSQNFYTRAGASLLLRVSALKLKAIVDSSVKSASLGQ